MKMNLQQIDVIAQVDAMLNSANLATYDQLRVTLRLALDAMEAQSRALRALDIDGDKNWDNFIRLQYKILRAAGCS